MVEKDIKMPGFDLESARTEGFLQVKVEIDSPRMQSKKSPKFIGNTQIQKAIKWTEDVIKAYANQIRKLIIKTAEKAAAETVATAAKAALTAAIGPVAATGVIMVAKLMNDDEVPILEPDKTPEDLRNVGIHLERTLRLPSTRGKLTAKK